MRIINKVSDIDDLNATQIKALCKELFIVQATLKKFVGKGDLTKYICDANQSPDCVTNQCYRSLAVV